MTVTVVVEADGAVSRVEVDAEKDAARCAKVADALYRMRCIPAMVGDVCVGRVLMLPVVFWVEDLSGVVAGRKGSLRRRPDAGCVVRQCGAGGDDEPGRKIPRSDTISY